jgi:hypothetical protein
MSPPELLELEELEDELLDELDDEELELDELDDELELDEELLELEELPLQAPKSVHAFDHAQPTPGSYAPPAEHQPLTLQRN